MAKHGYGTYTQGCRCDVCRAAKAAYMASRRAAARTRAQRFTRSASGERGTWSSAWSPGAERYVAPIRRHGTRAGYEEHGCRCRECSAARSASDRKYSGGAA